jgi:hypothetical protein
MLPLRRLIVTAIFRSCVLGATAGRAQDSEATEHSMVLEVGGAAEWPVRGGGSNVGGTLAGEFTPIEHWLELELGMTALASTDHTELSADLLFKKPFRLTSTAEFMFGAGPSLARSIHGAERRTSLSAEFDLDFMFWSGTRFGLYVEPSWSWDPRNGERSIGVDIGVLIGMP